MKYFKISILFVLSSIFILNSCESDIDEEKPIIDIDFEGAFPVNCDTLYFGDTITMKVLFTDNVELGSYSLDIHNNFDHHTHTTEVTECNLDDVKDPDNPFVLLENYSIPEGLSEYKTSLNIYIPKSDSEGVYDDGDYHFFISLTDKVGWSKQMGLSIKILQRK